MKPHRKVAAGGIAGALTVILVWILKGVGVDVPPEVASAITTVFATVAGYFA